MTALNANKQLQDLLKTAEAFRRAMIESGAVNHVSQTAYIEQLRALECALNPLNYRMTPSDVHNATAPGLVRQIVQPTLVAGGEFSDVMVLLESVIVGVMLVAVKLGGDDKVLVKLVDGVTQRMAEARLAPIAPEGSA